MAGLAIDEIIRVKYNSQIIRLLANIYNLNMDEEAKKCGACGTDCAGGATCPDCGADCPSVTSGDDDVTDDEDTEEEGEAV